MEKAVPAIKAQIKLAQISRNLNKIQKAIGRNVSVMAIVKANAYGHGLIPITKHLYQQHFLMPLFLHLV